MAINLVLDTQIKIIINSSQHNKRLQDNNITLLEDVNLYNFLARYIVSIHRNYKYKLYCNQKFNYYLIYYLKIVFIQGNKEYSTQCKYILIMFKYQFSNKMNMYKGIENINNLTIKLMKDYIERIIDSIYIFLNYLWVEIDMHIPKKTQLLHKGQNNIINVSFINENNF